MKKMTGRGAQEVLHFFAERKQGGNRKASLVIFGELRDAVASGAIFWGWGGPWSCKYNAVHRETGRRETSKIGSLSPWLFLKKRQ